MADVPETINENAFLVPMGDINNVERSVVAAEKYIEVSKRIRLAAIRLTNKADWSNQGNKPYLEKSGCDKIMGAFGVKIDSDMNRNREVLSDEKGEFVVYTVQVSGTWNNASATEMGTCSSRDDFFGKVNKEYKPLSEIDQTDLMKKAVTNGLNRLVKKLLGLSYTWEEIEALSNKEITRENVSGVNYDKGAKGGNTDSPETAKRRQEIRSWILTLCDGEENAAKAKLVALTAFQGTNGPVAGKDNVNKLSEKQIQIVHHKVKEEFEKFQKELDAQAAQEGAKNA